MGKPASRGAKKSSAPDPDPHSLQGLHLGPDGLLADRVADGIRTGIDEGVLVPGEVYSAYQLAEHLGVSRSPVREALVRLSEAGVVSMRRNRGFVLVRPDPVDVMEIFHLRLLLEVPAVETAAVLAGRSTVADLRRHLAGMRRSAAADDEGEFMRHDEAFHATLLEVAGNRRLVSTVARLRAATALMGASTVRRSRSLGDVAQEHVPVLDAVSARDGPRAARAMTGHLVTTARLLVVQAESDRGVDVAVAKLFDRLLGLGSSPDRA